MSDELAEKIADHIRPKVDAWAPAYGPQYEKARRDLVRWLITAIRLDATISPTVLAGSLVEVAVVIADNFTACDSERTAEIMYQAGDHIVSQMANDDER